MSDSPLYIAFLWHMHQPFYRDPFTRVYRLPWVRLHGTKDYLDMVSILDDYPEVRQTFNLVPSLLEQLIDYTDHGATDAFLEATRRRASDLTEDEKVFILENFFLANWETMIKPFPRYYELLLKRGMRYSRHDLKHIARHFTPSDFLDLQVFFNLTWVDPLFRNTDGFLSHLVSRGGNFTEDEKYLLIEKQFTILKGILPKYGELSERKQVELSTSPFYHPILPLLWDTESARIALPDARLPKRRFSHPEDARAQIRAGVDFFERTFGQRPLGMWPSEGSVSEDVVNAIHSEGLRWIATDEDILAASLKTALRGPSGNLLDPSLLYRAYEYAGLSLVFRDHKISDLLGFVYSGWDPKSAASDLIARLHHIRHSLPSQEPHLVPIILDGENAWEYYRNDAQDFFRYLYEGLSKGHGLKTTTIAEFLDIHRSRRTLDRLHAGSWIYGNFAVWIGHEEDNTAWDYLTETREALDAAQQENPGTPLESAWKALYVAEGSDWNWWYGDDHSTDLADDFDELYRLNLMKVYKEIGREVPPHLQVPIIREDKKAPPTVAIRGFISPKIDGIMTSYFEWYQGAHLDVGKSGGSMHMTESAISRIYYGFNQDNLFVRIDPKKSFDDLPAPSHFSIRIIKPFPFMLKIPIQQSPRAVLLQQSDSRWVTVKEISDVACGDILECAIPFRDILAKEHDELNFFITLSKDSEEIERCPWRGSIAVTVPSPHFEAMMWY